MKLSAHSPELMDMIRVAEGRIAAAEQLQLVTEHLLHAGMYARTVRLPAGVALTGVVIRIATVLIVHGDARILTDGGWVEVSGYRVLAGESGRKSVMVTESEVVMTMLFPTRATTVEAAEREFTDEAENLISRRQPGATIANELAISEATCLD